MDSCLQNTVLLIFIKIPFVLAQNDFFPTTSLVYLKPALAEEEEEMGFTLGTPALPTTKTELVSTVHFSVQMCVRWFVLVPTKIGFIIATVNFRKPRRILRQITV